MNFIFIVMPSTGERRMSCATTCGACRHTCYSERKLCIDHSRNNRSFYTGTFAARTSRKLSYYGIAQSEEYCGTANINKKSQERRF